MESLLLAALVLACPVGMGVMMWMMSKGMMGGRSGDREDSKDDSGAGAGSLAQLRREHDRLGAEIAELEHEGGEEALPTQAAASRSS